MIWLNLDGDSEVSWTKNQLSEWANRLKTISFLTQRLVFSHRIENASAIGSQWLFLSKSMILKASMMIGPFESTRYVLWWNFSGVCFLVWSTICANDHSLLNPTVVLFRQALPWRQNKPTRLQTHPRPPDRQFGIFIQHTCTRTHYCSTHWQMN